MLTTNSLYKLINECSRRLCESGIISDLGYLDENTVLIGQGSNLDSIGFISLVTEFEDEIIDLTGNDEFSFSLMDLSDFDEMKPLLTAGKLVGYAIEAS